MDEFINFIQLHSDLLSKDMHRLHILSDLEGEAAYAVVLPEHLGDELDATYIYQYFPESKPEITQMIFDINTIEWVLPLLQKAAGKN